MKKKCAIIGATGFGGLGLLEILTRHPNLEATQLFARKETGIKINEIFPSLTGFYDTEVKDLADIDYDSIDIAFFSTPDQAGMEIIKPFFERDIPVVDFSGDFRFNTLAEYKVYAENKSMIPEHKSPELLNHSVYGLAELNRDKIRNSKIVGNPGCFAISMILACLPLTELGLIKKGTIVADSKSGVSGAGKNPGVANFYPQRHENVNTYREGKHQHLVEVENIINMKNGGHQLFFIPQVVPISRGILSNIYADPSAKISSAELVSVFSEYYKDSPFVRITSKSPNLCDVRGSNFCIIRPFYDERTGKILVTSIIDNLMKGQSGNAIQNANIILGFDETAGIMVPGNFP
ncbi:MAG: N-acetyl-gamma-glutamyl-phosphate reductase [Spirochaetes bacterium]|nr:N-acetyl-gamma-glutamyl-phosphate reductase [Spirochaetota bacterium]